MPYYHTLQIIWRAYYPTTETSNEEYEFTAAFHYGKSLKLYTSELHNLRTENLEQIFGFCLLHAMLALYFTYDAHSDPSYNSTMEPCDMTWLRSLHGPRTIAESSVAIQQHLLQGIWGPLLLDSGLWRRADRQM
jgi:hypothetical protein